MTVNDNMNGRRVRNLAPHLPIVGIGASAGGVEALEQFFKSVPADHGLAFVIVTHLSPDRESLLSEILGRAARMPVVGGLACHRRLQNIQLINPSAAALFQLNFLERPHVSAVKVVLRSKSNLTRPTGLR